MLEARIFGTFLTQNNTNAAGQFVEVEFPPFDHARGDLDERPLRELSVLERSCVERKGSVPEQGLDLGTDQIALLQVLSHGQLVLGRTTAKFAARQVHGRELKPDHFSDLAF